MGLSKTQTKVNRCKEGNRNVILSSIYFSKHVRNFPFPFLLDGPAGPLYVASFDCRFEAFRRGRVTSLNQLIWFINQT